MKRVLIFSLILIFCYPTGMYSQKNKDYSFFNNFPISKNPTVIGKKLVDNFIQKPHSTFGAFKSKPADEITYPDACAWYGSLKFAEKTNDYEMQDRLIRKTELLLKEESNLIPIPKDVDRAVIGIIPLEVYNQTKDKRFLQIGLKPADEQFKTLTSEEYAKLPQEVKERYARGLSWHTRFWMDDMYMITALQSQAFRATNNPIYIERTAREMVAYLDTMQTPNGLFFHAPDVPYYWGRGDGWLASGMAELLKILPDNNPYKGRIMKGYLNMMGTLLKYQDKNGMWHQLLDDPNAWPETSSTAMFTFAFIVGVKNGWLDPKIYGSAAKKAWLRLCDYLDENYDLREICEGTNKLNNRQYYLDRKRIIGDLHGQAPMIWCATELAEYFPLKKVVSHTVRNGLPNFFKKIKFKNNIKIAYLGGSITRADNGWRDQSFIWLQKEYPNATFKQIMASIGGTGSDFGAYRLNNHVLKYNPDLVFIEFAVNDQGKSFLQVVNSMEGIVRQIKKYNPRIEICFVYTFQKSQLPFYKKNLFPISVSAMEFVANHYKIPSIFLGNSSIRKIQNGEMLIQPIPNESSEILVFSTDGVHPKNETGHRFYTEQFSSVFKSLDKNLKNIFAYFSELSNENLQYAKILSLNNAKFSKNWVDIDTILKGKPFEKFLNEIKATTDTTDFIEVEFTGKGFGIIDIIGPTSGAINVVIDNKWNYTVNRFDEYCTYNRMNYSIITNDLPYGKHLARIRCSSKVLDKLTILRKRNQIDKINDQFQKQVFYIGGFLVN